LFIISVGIILLGSLILLFGTEITESGIQFPPEVGVIASVIIGIGVILLLITIFLGIYSARGTIKSAWKDIKGAEREEAGEERARGRKRFRFAGAEAKQVRASIRALAKDAKKLRKKATKLSRKGDSTAAKYASRAEQIEEYVIKLEENILSAINKRNSIKKQNPDRATPLLDASIKGLEHKVEMYLSEIANMENNLISRASASSRGRGAMSNFYKNRKDSMVRALRKFKKSPARTRPRKTKTRARVRAKSRAKAKPRKRH